jgi:hypothetical protein
MYRVFTSAYRLSKGSIMEKMLMLSALMSWIVVASNKSHASNDHRH